MQQLQAWAGAGDVLAHDSDPVAVYGAFLPALLLIALVVGLVVRDRRRAEPAAEHDEDDEDERTEAGATPPRAG